MAAVLHNSDAESFVPARKSKSGLLKAESIKKLRLDGDNGNMSTCRRILGSSNRSVCRLD